MCPARALGADCGAAALITDAAGLAKVASLRDRLPALRLVLALGGGEGAQFLLAAIARAKDSHACAATGPADPALLIYTSCTTCSPNSYSWSAPR